MLHLAEDRKALERFMRHVVRRLRRGSTPGLGLAAEGQALVEYALMIPLLFVLMVNAVNFGGLIYGWIGISDAARAASQYAVLSGASINSPVQATSAQIKTLITNETSSLPGASSSNPSVAVCENNNGTITNITGTCTPAPTVDPEAPLYVSLCVDLTYTYTAFIPTFNFPLFGIVLPSNTVHKRVTMRMLQ